jgi:hypothetical protein
MNHHHISPLSPVTRLRAAAEALPQPTAGPASDDAFAPQLARACERSQPATGITAAARTELSPISDLASAPALRLWEARPAGEAAPAPAHQDDGSDPDTTDEQGSRPAEEEAADPPPPEASAGAVLVAITPLALRLAGNTLVAADGAAGESSFPAPELPPETAIPGSPRATVPLKLTAKPGEAVAPASDPLPTTPPTPTSPPANPAPAETAKAAPAKVPPAATLPAPAAETAPPPSPAGGTSAASLIQPMTVALDMNKTAGPEEQNLPSAPATVQMAAEKAVLRGVSASHTSSAGDPASLLAVTQPSKESVATAEKVTLTAPVDPTAKIAALMASAVVRLRQTGEDDFEVAIQPDENTEIMLRVTLQGDGAEIHAELRRGDSAAFAARWQELQERLAQQGVKLAALGAGDELSGAPGQNSEFRSPQQQSEADQDAAAFGYAETTTVTNTNTPRPAAAQPDGGRGWETWA